MSDLQSKLKQKILKHGFELKSVEASAANKRFFVEDKANEYEIVVSHLDEICIVFKNGEMTFQRNFTPNLPQELEAYLMRESNSEKTL